MGISLGKIVKSNSHTDYVCQVFGKNEVQNAPSPDDYMLGKFVRIDLEPSNKSECLVGLIYDTLLLNPDFGRMGPRLSPESELVTFAPDYLNERAVLVGITAIGRIKTGGEIIPLVPRVAANNDALVELMEDDDIRAFHTASGQLTLSYLPVLVQTGKPLAYHVARIVLLKLMDLLPEYEAELDVLEDDMSWLTQIGPLGGVQ